MFLIYTNIRKCFLFLFPDNPISSLLCRLKVCRYYDTWAARECVSCPSIDPHSSGYLCLPSPHPNLRSFHSHQTQPHPPPRRSRATPFFSSSPFSQPAMSTTPTSTSPPSRVPETSTLPANCSTKCPRETPSHGTPCSPATGRTAF